MYSISKCPNTLKIWTTLCNVALFFLQDNCLQLNHTSVSPKKILYKRPLSIPRKYSVHTMKFALALLLPALALACPEWEPSKCGPDDMPCKGGMDWDGCPMPDFCMPAKGPGDCPSFCPTKCGPEEMPCWGGMDPKGCMMPDTCIPMKGPMGKDGMECPSLCPLVCADGDMVCPGGMYFLAFWPKFSKIV